MINWIVLVVLIVVGIFAIKLNHLKHRFFIIILILLALFISTIITLLHDENDFDFKSADGIIKAGKVYLGWLGNGFHNVKLLSGKAIEMDWTSTNRTIFKVR